MIRPALLVLILATALACGGSQPASEASPASSGAAAAQPAATPPPAAAPAPAAAPSADEVPVLSSQGVPVSETATSPQDAAGIHFDVPAGWQQQTPNSGMRLAQAAIPGPAGAGEFAAFFFGPGGGGGVEANIDRWIGQMEGAGEPHRESFEAHGLKVTLVDVAGTMKASQMGTGPATAQSGYRLFGAVVEGPGGPWFFKATGPTGTLEAARADFLAMLHGLRAAA
jgi:hypothetical protein